MKKLLLPIVCLLFGVFVQAQNEFYFTGFTTEGASQNIDFSASSPATDGFGDHSDLEVKIDPNTDDPGDLAFKAMMSEDAYIKMWIDAPIVGWLEVVSSDSVVSSPYTGVGDPQYMGLLSQAPDGSYNFKVAGKTDGPPSKDADPNDPNMEVLQFTLVIDSEMGVAGNDFKGFTYYPNPVDTRLNLRAGLPIQHVAIYNLLGQEVKTFSPGDTGPTLSLADLDTGLYLMKIKINDHYKTVKIQKN